jgi:hypothetical protein
MCDIKSRLPNQFRLQQMVLTIELAQSLRHRNKVVHLIFLSFDTVWIILFSPTSSSSAKEYLVENMVQKITVVEEQRARWLRSSLLLTLPRGPTTSCPHMQRP